jgi:hypothetical protein
MRKWRAVMAIGVLGFCAACSKSDEEGVSVETWSGSTPHFRLAGNYQGDPIDVAIEGADAADPAKFTCTREYQAPLVDGQPDLTKARLHEVKLVGVVTVKGQRRVFELEFKRQDLSKIPAGTTLKVVPRDDRAPPPAGEFWFEIEWHDAATGDTLDERAANQGSFRLAEFTGQGDEHGIIPDNTGTFGGFLTATWSEAESLSM